MGIESGMNPAEAEASEAHEAKMEREKLIDAKVAGIRNNLGETRSEAEIRAQAEEETDAAKTVQADWNAHFKQKDEFERNILNLQHSEKYDEIDRIALNRIDRLIETCGRYLSSNDPNDAPAFRDGSWDEMDKQLERSSDELEVVGESVSFNRYDIKKIEDNLLDLHNLFRKQSNEDFDRQEWTDEDGKKILECIANIKSVRDKIAKEIVG